jgi:hypothetical protein
MPITYMRASLTRRDSRKRARQSEQWLWPNAAAQVLLSNEVALRLVAWSLGRMGGPTEADLNSFPIDYWHELETKAALLKPRGRPESA